jgi:hypothetical protein
LPGAKKLEEDTTVGFYQVVIQMTGGHNRSFLVDKFEHRFAASDDGDFGPLPLMWVVDDHGDTKVVEV